MKGSIRFFVGLFFVFGAVGNMDFDPSKPMWLNALLLCTGFGLMAWAVRDINAVHQSKAIS